MASIIQKLFVAKASWESAFIKNIPLDTDEDLTKKPYAKSDIAYICVSKTARAISHVPLQVCVKDIVDGEEVWVPVSSDDPWQQRFNHPNYLLDKFSFVEAIVSYLMLDGNVWFLGLPFNKKNPDVVPESVWVVSRKNISPKRDRKGHLEGWTYNPKGNKVEADRSNDVTLDWDEVGRTWFFNPYDPIMGLSPLEAGKLPLKVDYQASVYNQKFFDDGMSASGVLSTSESLNDKTFGRLKAQLEDRHKGYKKAQRLLILEKNLKFQQTVPNARDMEFYDLRRFNSKRIMQIFGMLGSIISETKDINRATADSERKVWWTTTNLPLMAMISSSLTHHFFGTDSGRAVRFDVSNVEALRTDFGDKVEIAEKLTKMGWPINSINEVLELGFDPVPWGNTWWKPISTVDVRSEIGEDGSPLLPEETPEPSPEEEPEEEPMAPEEEPEEEPEDGEGATKIKILKSAVTDRERHLWDNMARLCAPYEKRFGSKTSRVFYEMRKRALALLTGEKSSARKGVEDVFAEDFDDYMDDYIASVRGLYGESLLLGFDALAAENGLEMSLDLQDPVAIEYLSTKVPRVKVVRDTIKLQLRDVLVEGMDAGESIDQLADRVRSVFNTAVNRSKTIARTEVVGSSNFGRSVGIQRSSFKRKKWITARDEKVRDTHISMDGTIIDVGASWVVGMTTLRYPGDYLGAPGEIINCRCIEIALDSA